ncbi:Carboxypeptidase [Thalictrum thalictroides]|uniref:Carboxypeptidase n=1 Tax=Thalictrum thalictroides TaxID=46969 RepID=A0A7J6W1C4_THATH|nr:Carboxypeptidase [Thalictrum thalictroides]
MTRAGTSLLVLLVLVFWCSSVAYGGRGDNRLHDFIRIHRRKQLESSSFSSSTTLGDDINIATNELDGMPNDENVYKVLRNQAPQPVPDFPVYMEPQDGLQAADKIVSLPGQPRVHFNQYSGYVTVDGKAGRALFYYFVEATKFPSTKPLVLWLNGGPGCSSIGSGALTALGPFRVHNNRRTLKRNPHAWNKKANIIFLESPAFVGFSYSNTTTDFKSSGDTRTAHDAYTFLVNWLERFPEYKNREFYLAGESYAGHYIPQLADVIIQKNIMTTNQNIIINLQGLAVGNGLLDELLYMKSRIEFYYTRSMISEEMKDQLLACVPIITDACLNLETKFEEEITKDIFPYNIYSPSCNSTSASPWPPNTRYDPCIEDYVREYLNLPEVQKALHVRALPYRWSECNDEMRYIWSEKELTILPILRDLMASGINIWLYGGDTDGAVPLLGIQSSIKELGATVKTEWYPWYNSPKEVGGFAVEYENVTYVTVRGAGHFVPSYQPSRAYTMFSSFLQGTLPPTNTTAKI